MRASYTRRASFILRTTLLVLLVAACQAASAIQAADRPSPAGWEQWQPQVDQSDSRLDAARVSCWEAAITLGDLLPALSAESSVTLTATEELRPWRIDGFLRDRSLDGVMACLADIVQGYWVYPRGAGPGERQYCLVPQAYAARDPDTEATDHWRALREARAAHHRPFREGRVALYESAQALSAEDLLRQYEQTDPWLCADLLDPAVRPMIGQLSRLSSTQRDELLTEGEVSIRTNDCDAGFRRHLAEWAKGRWGRPATMRRAPDPDEAPRFSRPEDRWENAIVRLRWSRTSLFLQLDVPDVARFDVPMIRTPKDPPLPARMALANLGYRSATPEYTQSAERENSKWAETWLDEVVIARDDPAPAALVTGLPDSSDPRLALVVDLAAISGEGPPIASALERVAAQHGLAVLATSVPREACSLSLPDDGPACTLGALLGELRRRREGALTWSFRGDYLLIQDSEFRLIQASTLPDSSVREWEALFLPGSSVPLSELASRLSELNWLQTQELYREFPGSRDTELEGIRLYGLVGAGQAAGLSDSRGLPYSGLTTDQRREVLRVVHRARPWLLPDDMSSSVLRTLPRALSTGEQGISLLIEYGFTNAPSDRDILFTSPLVITIPVPPPSGDRH